MKIIAILMMLLGVALVIGAVLMTLIPLAMSFDAPGSITDPKAWLMRLLFFIPALLLAGLLFGAFVVYRQGDYARSAYISAVFPLLLVGYVAFYLRGVTFTRSKLSAEQAQRAEEARLYPKQTFVREVPGGADTLIVFPDRMVAFRKYDGLKYPLGGLLGYLNEARTHIQLHTKPNPVIRREELPQFTDADGRRFSDIFPVQE